MPLLGFAWVVSFLGMLGLLGYQLLQYLRQGEWIGFDVPYACARYMNVAWCSYPTDWVGLHRLLSLFNAGFFVWLVCTLLFLGAFLIWEDAKK